MDVQSISDNFFSLVILGMAGSLLLAGGVIFFYLKYQRRFLLQRDQLQKKEIDHKMHLLHTAIQSQEEERIRISRDLHDHVGSRLSGLRLLAGRMKQSATGVVTVTGAADDIKQGIDEVITDIRNIAHGLLPHGLSLWGFYHAMEDLCEKTRAASDLNVSLSDQTSGELKNMKFETALALYRVMQEAFTNTIRHAAAKNIGIVISAANGNIAIHYKDDGKGTDMNEKSKGLGLYNMESRLSMIQATYNIETSPGNGFNLFIHGITIGQ